MLSTTSWPLFVELSFVTIVFGSASMTIVVWPVAETAGCATAGAAAAGLVASAGFAPSAGLAASAGLDASTGFAGSAGFVAGAAGAQALRTLMPARPIMAVLRKVRRVSPGVVAIRCS